MSASALVSSKVPLPCIMIEPPKLVITVSDPDSGRSREPNTLAVSLEECVLRAQECRTRSLWPFVMPFHACSQASGLQKKACRSRSRGTNIVGLEPDCEPATPGKLGVLLATPGHDILTDHDAHRTTWLI